MICKQTGKSLNNFNGEINIDARFSYATRYFIYKNDVQVTKNVIMIRLNSWNGKRIYFDHIASTDLTESTLIVTKINGEQITFDAKGIHLEDLQKLNELLLSKSESYLKID